MAFERRNLYLLNSGDILLRVMAVWLVFAPSGAALSWDRWRSDRATSGLPAPRALGDAAAADPAQRHLRRRRVGEDAGRSWREGTSTAFALRMLDQLRYPTPALVSGSPLITEWLTFSTLAIELSVGILVWNRVLRPWVLGLGALLHLGIEIFIMIGFFSIAVWCLYLVFIPPETAERLVIRLRDRLRARRFRSPEVDTRGACYRIVTVLPSVVVCQ